MSRPINVTDRTNVEITVDEKMVDKVLQYGSWYRNANGYIVIDQETERGQITQVLLHRLVYELAFGPLAKGQYVEHLDGDQDNNLLDNITIVNTRHYLDSLTNRRGYFWHTKRQLWQAQVSFNGKTKILGWYKTEIKAYEAHMKARTIYKLASV